jgi:hypothetical protein
MGASVTRHMPLLCGSTFSMELVTAMMSTAFWHSGDTTAAAPQQMVQTELKLEAGRFAAFPGTAIGEPIAFQNDIDSNPCYPLIAITGWSQAATLKFTGPVLTWIHRAHRVGTRVVVEPCELMSPLASPPATVEGAVSKWWFEATLVDSPASPRVELRRLALPRWDLFSNPAPCGQSIAYWSMGGSDGKGSQLTAMVADLLSGRMLASRSLGSVSLETDNRWCLRRPTWDKDCRAATFDATAEGKGTVRLDSIRKRGL